MPKIEFKTLAMLGYQARSADEKHGNERTEMFQPGDVVELPKKRCEEFIAAGAASYVDAKTPEQTRETATAGPAETRG